MKERLGVLLGDGLESKLVLGTFHSIARRYLVWSTDQLIREPVTYQVLIYCRFVMDISSGFDVGSGSQTLRTVLQSSRCVTVLSDW